MPTVYKIASEKNNSSGKLIPLGNPSFYKVKGAFLCWKKKVIELPFSFLEILQQRGKFLPNDTYLYVSSLFVKFAKACAIKMVLIEGSISAISNDLRIVLLLRIVLSSFWRWNAVSDARRVWIFFACVVGGWWKEDKKNGLDLLRPWRFTAVVR